MTKGLQFGRAEEFYQLPAQPFGLGQVLPVEREIGERHGDGERWGFPQPGQHFAVFLGATKDRGPQCPHAQSVGTLGALLGDASDQDIEPAPVAVKRGEPGQLHQRAYMVSVECQRPFQCASGFPDAVPPVGIAVEQQIAEQEPCFEIVGMVRNDRGIAPFCLIASSM